MSAGDAAHRARPESSDPRGSPPSRHPPGTLPDQDGIRPYVITGGRTRPDIDLGWETMVWTTGPAAEDQPAVVISAEGRRAAQLCRRPRSITEIAAFLGLPLAVSQIVVSDLARARIVTVHRPTGTTDSAMVHRVLRKLRTL
jgi:Protein of unknown function (DUF742)